MRTFLSILRYISFIILLMVFTGIVNIPLLGLIYPIVIIISWLTYSLWRKKHGHGVGDFVGELIMADIVTPLNWFWDTLRATRIWNIWFFRKKKRRGSSKRTFKEMLITSLIRMIIVIVLLMVAVVVITLFE